MDAQRNSIEDGPASGVSHAADHIIGLISRLLGAAHWSAAQKEAPAGDLPANDVVVDIGTPAELRALAATAPKRLAQETNLTHDQEELAEKQKIKVLLQTHLAEAMWNGLLSQVRPAAERGERELQLLRFPSDLCTDGGRKIRVGEEGWQETLQGEAAELKVRWKRDLSQKGFGLAARTLEYHGGMPGDVGLFVTWHG